jgi:hypothetical protein
MTDYHKGKVTPKDIRAAIEAAVFRGGDRELLERQYREVLAEFSSEESLARAWTMANAWEAFREQVYPAAAPKPQPPAKTRSVDDRERLAQLIRDYPELARDMLDKQPPE